LQIKIHEASLFSSIPTNISQPRAGSLVSFQKQNRIPDDFAHNQARRATHAICSQPFPTPLSSGSARPLREDTASCLRLPISTAWSSEPPATSVRTSRSRPTSAAFVKPCARFFTRPVPLLPWFAWTPACFDLVWFGFVCF